MSLRREVLPRGGGAVVRSDRRDREAGDIRQPFSTVRAPNDESETMASITRVVLVGRQALMRAGCDAECAPI